MSEVSAPRRPTAWHRCRRAFRWLRITALTLVLVVLGLLTWLRIAGLPAFLRTRLVIELAQHGVAAEFDSLHFQWFRGLVARGLRIGWGGPEGPQIDIDEADLDLAPPPWDAAQPFIRGLVVRRGDLRLPLALSNQPPAELRIDQLTAAIRFLPGDAWEVQRLAAEVAGIQLELRAHLTNVLHLRRPPPTPDPEAVTRRIRLVRSLLEELHQASASTPPRLEARLRLDGRQPWSAEAEAFLHVPDWKTPHGDLRDVRLSLRTDAADPATPDSLRAHSLAVLEFASFTSPRHLLERGAARIRFDGPPRPDLPTNAVWTLRAARGRWNDLEAHDLTLKGTNTLLEFPSTLPEARVRTRAVAQVREVTAPAPDGDGPLTATRLLLALDARHTLSPAPPERVAFTASLDSAHGPPGATGRTRLEGEVIRRPNAPAVTNDLGRWSALWPWQGTVSIETENVASPRLQVSRFATQVTWEPPLLRLPRISGTLYGGDVVADADLDVLTRTASARAETTFDLHGIDPLLGPRSRENFQRYQWTDPPRFRGRASVVLPAWTDPQPDWDGTVKPTIRVEGSFRVGTGGFKGIPFDEAESSLHFDGEWWRLPDLRTRRPEGRQEIAVEYNDNTREYRIDARGTVFPPVLKPVLGPHSGEVLDLFLFREPVTADLSIYGPWSEGTRQAIVGKVRASGFVFRGEGFDQLDAEVCYTNRALVATRLHLGRGDRSLQAEGLGYAFPEDRLWITNAVNTLEPAAVVALISPGFLDKLAHYRFDTPPRIRVDGTVRPRDTAASADLAFQIEGGPFHFWRLSADSIATRLLWQGSNLTLTNLQARFYGGDLEGDAMFDVSQPGDSPYRFTARVADARLEDLLREATPGRTNVSQGVFDLDLHVDSAHTADIHSWTGHGRAELTDGLLWDVPIFGFLSPVLNAFLPGLGNNRAERADATFTLTNSVIHTRDLVIACSPVKLLYRGTIDFDQRVNAKVEGQILNELAGFGPLIGFFLRPLTKLLEFRVTGTLAEVKAEPLYIPRFLLYPLQPGRLLRGLLRGEESPHESPPVPPTNRVPQPGNPAPTPERSVEPDDPADRVP